MRRMAKKSSAEKKLRILLIKNCLGLHKGCPSYRRNLQPSKENIQHFNIWNFLSLTFGSFLPSWIQIRIHWPNWIRIRNTGFYSWYVPVQPVWPVFMYLVLYSTLLHLPTLRFQCVAGCWDWTQDCYNVCIAQSNHKARPHPCIRRWSKD